MPDILIVEPYPLVREGLAKHLREAGFQAEAVESLGETDKWNLGEGPVLAVIDLSGPDEASLQPLKTFHSDHPDIPIIVTTAMASTETMVEAMKSVAVDLLRKPFPPHQLVERVKTRLHRSSPLPHGAVGESRAMKNISLLISRIADSGKSVLLMGESGVGKSFFARVVHRSSSRASKCLLSLDCSAFSEEVFLESELFGVARGAYPGADTTREGALVRANQGTLILEAVDSLPDKTQSRLLHYLETGEVRRVGENQPISTNTRIIATLRKDAAEEKERSALRPDLLFRLKNLFIEIPPLRERTEDIPPLIRHFLEKARDRGAGSGRMTKEAMSLVCSLRFPGNVLELKNLVEQVLSVSHDGIIDLKTLERAGLRGTQAPVRGALHQIEATEREIIRQVVNRHPRDLDAAARELGLSRTTLWRRMKKHQLLEGKSRGRSRGDSQ